MLHNINFEPSILLIFEGIFLRYIIGFPSFPVTLSKRLLQFDIEDIEMYKSSIVSEETDTSKKVLFMFEVRYNP
jgi:hypothetical protein